jgi:hypothetical protein
MKSTGAAIGNHLAECMKHLVWSPCRADRDLWMKAETHPDGGVLYWAYILIYVDDILFVHHDPGDPLVKLDESFKIKEGSIQVLLLGCQTEEYCIAKWHGCLGRDLQKICTVCCPECTGVSGGTPWGPEAAEEGIWPICREIQACA